MAKRRRSTQLFSQARGRRKSQRRQCASGSPSTLRSRPVSDRCRTKGGCVNLGSVQFNLVRTPFASAVAQKLCDEIQAEYVRRYGDGDETPIELDDFNPPNGDFIVAFNADGEPVGCGGWRAHEENDAEMKRLYVREDTRRQGLARLLVAAVEASAAEAGRKRVVLETGPAQPEAIAMYRSIGYEPVTPFGYYACTDGSIHLGRELLGEQHASRGGTVHS